MYIYVKGDYVLAKQSGLLLGYVYIIGSLITLLFTLMVILAQSLGYPLCSNSILGLLSIMSQLNPWAVPHKVLAQSLGYHLFYPSSFSGLSFLPLAQPISPNVHIPWPVWLFLAFSSMSPFPYLKSYLKLSPIFSQGQIPITPSSYGVKFHEPAEVCIVRTLQPSSSKEGGV